MKKRNTMRVLSFLLAFMILIGVMPDAAAEDTGTTDTTGTSDTSSTTVAVTNVTLDRTDLQVEVGATSSIVATVEPSDASDSSVTWSSSNTSVVTVDTNGTVSAKAPGTSVVTVSSNADSTKKASCTVTVPGIVLSDASISLVKGNSETIGKTLYGGISTNSFTWSSSNDTIAAVDTNGKVTAVSEGTATITVESSEGYSASCSVEVETNEANVISASVDDNDVLEFSSLDSKIDSICDDMLDSSLSYITGLNVATDAGILYYNYISDDDPGAGVGSLEKYYYSTSKNGVRYLSDVSFVPKSGYSGTTDISYSAFSSSGQFFTGTIRVTVEESENASYSTSKNTPVTLNASDFSTICRQQTGRDINYVTFSLPSSSRGILYYNYTSDSVYESKVTTRTYYYRSGNPALNKVTFMPASGYTGTVWISYTGVDTAGTSFSGNITIRVSNSNTSSSSTITNNIIIYSATRSDPAEFSASDFNEVCQSKEDNSLDYVKFTLPSSSKGILYYNYSSSSSTRVSSSKKYYRNSSPYLSDISFVPASGYSGTVEIDYRGVDTDGNSYSGYIKIRVNSSSSDDSISYSATRSNPAEFDASDFSDVCQDETDYNLNYVKFTLPSSSKGTLYYNYSNSNSTKVSSSTKYYRSSSPYLSDISFVPASGYSGTFEIDYTGYNTNGDSFSGYVTIKAGGSSDDSISYSATRSNPAEFDTSDFNDVCQNETDYNLNYVKFTLPSSSKGTLYYNYSNSNSTKVSSSTKYYRSSSPYLSDISFVPASGYSGTFEIDYTGYNTNGDSFSGYVTIKAGSSSDDSISYSATRSNPAEFDTSDFNDVCQNETDYNLNYVKFTLPSSSKGTLYYNYSNSNSTKVSSSTKYYRSSSPYLSDISFVPASGYSGTFEIDYTGYNTNGDSFSGYVTIKAGSSSGDSISYSATRSNPAEFDSSDFNDVCRDETDYNLNYVKFTLPSSSKGTLYYNYSNSDSTKVSSSTKYYRSSSPYLSDISFVSASGYSGTFEIDYTGYNTNGDNFTGTVSISVNSSSSDAELEILAYNSSGGAVTFSSTDLNRVCKAETGDTLYKVRFTLPSSSFGVLWCNYSTSGQTKVDDSTDFYYSGSPAVNDVSFVPASSYQGTGTLDYTGTDIGGNSFSGQIKITVQQSSHFTDMSSYSWATQAVEYLYQKNVVSGVGNSRYNPSASITRGDFILMLCRAFNFNTSGNTDNFSDVPADSYYSGAIAAAKKLGIANGSNGKFYPKQALIQQDAMLFIQRAMQIDGWSVPDGTANDLVAFKDASSVSSYAVGAVSGLVNLGIINGDGSGYLNPQSTLTRAGMAVILYRVLTL